MLRIDFIKTLISSAVISPFYLKENESFQKIYISQFFIAGFKFYNGLKLLPKMKLGDILTLVREPDNEYDNCAIALHWNKEKIGFIPASENTILAALLDADDLNFIGEITHIETQTKPWENIAAAVSYLKKVKKSKAIKPVPEYLLTIAEPEYKTKKWVKKSKSISGIDDFFDSDTVVLKLDEFPDRLNDVKDRLIMAYHQTTDSKHNQYLVIKGDGKYDLMYEIFDSETITDINGNSFVKGIFALNPKG